MTSYYIRFKIKNTGLAEYHYFNKELEISIDAKDLKSAKNKIANKYLSVVNTQRKYDNKKPLQKLIIEILDATINGYY